MGCSTSTASVAEAPTLKNSENPNSDKSSEAQASDIKYPASEAFIIPLENDCEMTSYNPMTSPLPNPGVNKIPSKRIQKLMEQAATAEQSFDLKNIEEKLNKADERRKEYLQQKVEKTQMMNTNIDDLNEVMNITKIYSREKDYSDEDYKKTLNDDSKR